MARGKHRKPKRQPPQPKRQHEQESTTTIAGCRRVNSAGSGRFFTPLVWVVILLGVSVIFTSVKGINVTIKMEP